MPGVNPRENCAGPLELWGGLESTVNRVGDVYFDQLCDGRYATTVEDFDRFADLGLRAFRMPVLWERVAPRGPDDADWSWTDPRLARLRDRGVAAIVGLVHHGSGPPTTDLTRVSFARGLARFARAVAERYPWVRDYTPVNEPLTTARFSGLYGHWYPHGRDDRTFCIALVNQCRAVAMAMSAIREIRSDARLVQTEDLGKTHSSPPLAYQADMENERRWLSFDLLSGRVRRGHPLHAYLLRSGVREADLGWFVENPCPPDILGINHYVTSERYLDHRLDRYPGALHGGNGRHRYADVEALRVLPGGACGPRVLLGEAWDRYRSPIAVTEAHLGCTREEQMRWFVEVWDAARELRREGADVRAVTAWSLLGAFDWSSLVTRDEGRYEPGIFDLRGPEPRPTAMAGLLTALARGDEPDHPVLTSPGWWRRPERLFPWARASADASAAGVGSSSQARRPLLIVGAAGALSHAFARLCEVRGLPFRVGSRADLGLADGNRIGAALDARRPWAVIDVNVDMDGQVDSTASLAGECSGRGIALLAISAGHAPSGDSDRPHAEPDPNAPTGDQRLRLDEWEARVQGAMPGALLIRTGTLFGPWDEHNDVARMLRKLAAGSDFVDADDSVVAPTYLPDLVDTSLNLLIDGERGIWQLTHPGETMWPDLARKVAALAGLDPVGVTECPPSAAVQAAVTPGRPRRLMPTLDDALVRFVAECKAEWTSRTASASIINGMPWSPQETFSLLNFQHM